MRENEINPCLIKSEVKINFFLKKLHEENLIDGETYAIAKKLLKEKCMKINSQISTCKGGD